MQRIAVIGLGPIGAACARVVLAESDMKLVALYDIDPAKQGLSAQDVTEGQPETAQDPLDIEQKRVPHVSDSLEAALAARPDVAIVATTSCFDEVAPTIERLLDAAVHVVSPCEQLAWPWYAHRELADRIDLAARAAGCVVLGTGANPGFVMDALPVMLATVVRRVKRLHVLRRVDASVRRSALQKKIGATMGVNAFRELAARGEVGHVGLPESLAMIAAGLGCHVEPGSVQQTIEPVLAEAVTPSAMGLIRAGEVAGIHQTANWSNGKLDIELDLTMAVGVRELKDRITIDGPVPLALRIPGATPGDSATIAALLNQARQIDRIAPGLKTMIDVPPAGSRQA